MLKYVVLYNYKTIPQACKLCTVYEYKNTHTHHESACYGGIYKQLMTSLVGQIVSTIRCFTVFIS